MEAPGQLPSLPLKYSAEKPSGSMDAYLSAQQSLGSDDSVEDVTTDIGVDSTQRVVDEIDRCTLVDRACQIHSLLLTTAQVRALPTA